jgi:hypothetical protein
MKKFRILYKLMFALIVPAFILSCEEDEEEPATAEIDFLTISSAYNEADGTGTLTVPIRGTAAANSYSFEFGGTATEGEDYEVVGVTGEGFQVSIIDDNEAEPDETIRVRMVSPSLNLNGNAIHTIHIASNCEDTNASDLEFFRGEWSATEKYGPTEAAWYGPYDILLLQDADDPNKFHFDNFYDSGCDAYIVFDLAAGTVYFPDQKPCANGKPVTNSNGTFTLDPCNAQLTINLNYDGGDWVYSFLKL